MAIRWNFIIFIVVVFTFNITEFECRRSSHRKLHGNENKTDFDKHSFVLESPVEKSILDFDLSATDVIDNASGMFKKFIGKWLTHKKLVGFDPGWYR